MEKSTKFVGLYLKISTKIVSLFFQVSILYPLLVPTEMRERRGDSLPFFIGFWSAIEVNGVGQWFPKCMEILI